MRLVRCSINFRISGNRGYDSNRVRYVKIMRKQKEKIMHGCLELPYPPLPLSDTIACFKQKLTIWIIFSENKTLCLK